MSILSMSEDAAPHRTEQGTYSSTQPWQTQSTLSQPAMYTSPRTSRVALGATERKKRKNVAFLSN